MRRPIPRYGIEAALQSPRAEILAHGDSVRKRTGKLRHRCLAEPSQKLPTYILSVREGRRATNTIKEMKPKLTDAGCRKRFVGIAHKVAASENSEDLDRVFSEVAEPKPQSKSENPSQRSLAPGR